jgi:protein-disulfide isomerase
VPIEGDPFQGPADAKVTVVKAYDYACPFCEKVRDTMDELRKKYGNDVRIVYKQFVVHPQVATSGALAACAASKQGGPDKFVAFDNLLWDKGFKTRQFDKDVDPGAAAGAEKGSGAPAGAPVKCWDSPGGCPIVLGFAKELGLDEAKFKADMKGDCQQLIAKDMKDLQQLGVGATPSFFINGRFISGAGPVEGFEAVIDEELKKANEKIQSGVPAAQYYQQVIVDKGQKTLDAPKPQ